MLERLVRRKQGAINDGDILREVVLDDTCNTYLDGLKKAGYNVNGCKITYELLISGARAIHHKEPYGKGDAYQK